MIARYLLGDLSEAEAAQLEDSSFSNAEQLEELRSVENDLIDEYARGELPAEERAKFERLFFANPARRQRVEFALALARVSSPQVSSPAPIPRKETRTFRDFFFRPSWAPRSALIYATLALAGIALIGVWWFSTRTNMRNQQIASQQPTPLNTGAGSPPPSAEASTQSSPSDKPRETPSRPGNENVLPDNSKGGNAGPAIATVVLLPGTSRSGGERTKLVIPPGRQLMRLELKLEERDAISYRSFAAELTRANSKKAWASGNLSIQRNEALILNIPVSSLSPATADYELILRGRSARGGAFETIGYYYLTIVRE